MAQDYPLEELSPRAFEQLTVSLGLQVLGNGVSAFGSGPDGGREATYQGVVNWGATDFAGKGNWDGYVVLQAKQKEQVGTPAQNLSWLRKQVSEELDSWMDPSSRRGRFPQYLLIVTNVRLSSTPSSGGIDQINDYLSRRLIAAAPGSKKDSLAARGLREVRVWHRDQLNGLLTKYQGVRSAFKGLLTVGDILTRLNSLGGVLEPSEFEPVMMAHAKRALGSERWVNFSEAGGENRQSVENVIIDLAAENHSARESVAVLQNVIERADSVLKPSIAPQSRHIVLTGQPGSGKSTITLFLTQMYRVAFTAEELLTPTLREVQSGTASALQRVGAHSPRNRRWPIRVNLAKYADELGPSGEKSLLRWMSERISDRAELNILPNALGRWIKNWPSLVILDGLDEVTAPEVRPRVLDEIRALVEDSDADDADVLVVVTTRPTGYTERLMPDRFDQLDLSYLDERTAIAYGRHVTTRRLADDLDRRDQVIERFERHAGDASMLRLMKTPLQVLIMTFILERFGSLPANKYELFWRYFETIYARESAKPTNLARFISEQRREIVDLHEGVGLELQVLAEGSSDARSIMSKSRLRELVILRLRELGNEPGQRLDRVADQIVQASTDRLVLLVPAEDEGISFEIRSLQELMAARALAKGREGQIRERLSIAAPSPHWRNTLVFLAGKIFADGADHERDMVVEVVEDFDQRSGWPGWLCPMGPELAANLLDDGLAATTPKWRRRLIDVALRALSGPVPSGLNAIATALAEAGDKNDHLHIRSELKSSLAGMQRSQEIARLILTLTSFGPPIPGQQKPFTASTMREPQLISQLLRGNLESLEIEGNSALKVQAALEELDLHQLTDVAPVVDGARGPQRTTRLSAVIEALSDEEANAALELLFEALLPEHWSAAAELSFVLSPDLSRTPVGQLLVQ